MTAWTIAALIATTAFAVTGVALVRGSIETRLVALALATSIGTLDLLAIAESFATPRFKGFAISDGDAGGYIAWIAGSAAVLATVIAWSLA